MQSATGTLTLTEHYVAGGSIKNVVHDLVLITLDAWAHVSVAVDATTLQASVDGIVRYSGAPGFSQVGGQRQLWLGIETFTSEESAVTYDNLLLVAP